MKKTKIICTIGPSSESKEVLTKLIQAGMNASRHNFSHGDHDDHARKITLVKKLSKELNQNIAIILDTKGPEIRTGFFEKGQVELKEGNDFTVYCEEEVTGDETKCSVSYEGLHKDVKPGNIILIDDGSVGLDVLEIHDNKIRCRVRNSGAIGNHKGVNVPGVKINLPAITEKDIDDLKFGVQAEVDIVAASFIRKASDVLEIRRILDTNGGKDIQIYSKIENQEGVDNLDEIIEVSDGVMVARGDLGVEIPIEQVPLVQKMIIEKCNYVGKPVITATQMLDSMIRKPSPTRAEATDIANAIFDGTDCIMLSGETANGKYPVESVVTMSNIAIATEKVINYTYELKKRRNCRITDIANAISLATCSTAIELNAKIIITTTESGYTARRVSKFRPECPIIAITPNENVARKLALNWGVIPIVSERISNTDEAIEKSVKSTVERGYVEKGDLVIIAAGIPLSEIGNTNMMKVHIV